jgi:hypothetical protein
MARRIAVGRFADANTARAAQHADDLRNNPFRLFQILALP